jgi:hypothetical protein
MKITDLQKQTLTIAGLTIGVFVLTNNPLTKLFRLQLTLVSLLALLFYTYLFKRRGETMRKASTFLLLLTTFILFLIASTGWFFSPFFFSLYLLAILLAFVWSPLVSFGFIATLVGLFSLNIGDVDLVYDFLVVISLLTVIPLGSYLRREYLHLEEEKKKILVLEQEREQYLSKIDELLANRMHEFVAWLREPVNNIRQLAHRLEKYECGKHVDRYRKRIIAESERALGELEDFEKATTGKELLSTPENA